MNKVPVLFTVVPPSPSPPTQSVLANVGQNSTFLTGYFATPTGGTAQPETTAAAKLAESPDWAQPANHEDSTWNPD